MEVAQKYQDQLKRIKKNIERAFSYAKPNIARYHKFQQFVFKSALSDADEATLKAMGKPIIEFNITNAPISRLCGEFSKQEPSVYCTAQEGFDINPQTIELVEGHLRYIISESDKHNTQYAVHRDQLTGGLSAFKVWTEYAHEMSMDQVIKFGRPFDPTLVLFDPMAREVDKSDAQYCGEVFPMQKDEFKERYPKVDMDELKPTASMKTMFEWCYSFDNAPIVVVVDYYEKKRRYKKIAKLVDASSVPQNLAQEWESFGFRVGKVMAIDDYDEKVEQWMQNGFTAQPPSIVGEPRKTEITYVCRYRLIGTEVIEYIETEFKSLPLIFVDGDSIILRNGDSNSMEQFTKPYVYHAEGLQRLTNFSGQVIANDFENMVMHKFKVAEESLPTEAGFRDAYTNWQTPNTLIYKALYNDDPNIQLPPPQEIQRVPLPPEVGATFNGAMGMLQNILGSYDASLGINDNQLSGVAIVESATQSNAAAMPYIVNYMHSLNTAANIILDLLPKLNKTKRTIPIVDKEGKRHYVDINTPGGPSFDYEENSLHIKVEAGVNFQIAKNQALKQIIALMQASPMFAQMINTEGLDLLVDNLDFKGSQILVKRVESFMQQMKQQQVQQANQPNPEQMKMQIAQGNLQLKQQELQHDQAQLQSDNAINTQKMGIENKKADNERLKIMLDTQMSKDQMKVSIAKAQAEEERAQAQLETQHAGMHLDAYVKGHEIGHDKLRLRKELREEPDGDEF